MVKTRYMFVITRHILSPYGVLVVLYLLVVGGGGAWLYYRVRAFEASLAIEEMSLPLGQLAGTLRDYDGLVEMYVPVYAGLASIKGAIFIYIVAGLVSIVFALAVTLLAAGKASRLGTDLMNLHQRAKAETTVAPLLHELRNRLASMRANLQALFITPEQRHEILADLDRDIVSLNDRLNAFRDLYRRREQDVGSVDISWIVADAARLARPALDKWQLHVTTDLPEDLPRPAWNKTALGDALLNLLVNAAQSGQRGGVIHVSARRDVSDIKLTVEDEGEGIPEHVMPLIFDAFFPLVPTATAWAWRSSVSSLPITRGISMPKTGRRAARASY